MAKDINLTSPRWNDIVFEGKNKEYGAYEMRQSSSIRHIIAFFICLAVVVFVSFLPQLIETVAPKKTADNLSDESVLANLQKELEKEIEQKDIIREETKPETPPLKSTIQFTAPEIVDATEITDENEIKSQDDFLKSKVQVSAFNVTGTDEDKGVDFADLDQHKKIAEEKDDNIVYDVVEQKAEFPGGAAAMEKYKQANLKYPQVAADNGVSGTVYLRFTVNKNGNITNITPVREADENLVKEAIRYVSGMPKWLPGKKNGKAVNSYFILPVKFVLQE